MCRGCVIIIILCLIADSLMAQPIHLAEDSLEFQIADSSSITELQNYVINDTEQAAYIQWLKNFTAPDSWIVNLCDDVACYGESETESVLYINAGDSSQLKAQFFADIPGEGRLNVSVTALDADGNPYTIQTSYSLLKTLGTSLPELISSISYSPNPAHSFLNINVSQSYSYQLFDLSGRPYQLGQLESGKNQISLESLEAGIYILRLNSKMESLSLRIQKAN